MRTITWNLLYNLLLQYSKTKCPLIPTDVVYNQEQGEIMENGGLKTGASGGGDSYCRSPPDCEPLDQSCDKEARVMPKNTNWKYKKFFNLCKMALADYPILF